VQLVHVEAAAGVLEGQAGQPAKGTEGLEKRGEREVVGGREGKSGGKEGGKEREGKEGGRGEGGRLY
jgi:hypothetical protein